MDMREILFRGQGIMGEWHDGNLSVLKKKINGVDAGSYISNIAGMPFAYMVRPETVGQFTGSTDKNGVKIFEGDELKVNTSVDNSDEPFDLDPEMIEQEITVSVTWNDNAGSFDLITIESDLHLTGWGFGYGEDAQEFEVIGNIHKTKKPCNQ